MKTIVVMNSQVTNKTLPSKAEFLDPNSAVDRILKFRLSSEDKNKILEWDRKTLLTFILISRKHDPNRLREFSTRWQSFFCPQRVALNPATHTLSIIEPSLTEFDSLNQIEDCLGIPSKEPQDAIDPDRVGSYVICPSEEITLIKNVNKRDLSSFAENHPEFVEKSDFCTYVIEAVLEGDLAGIREYIRELNIPNSFIAMPSDF